jgi:Xaa-Pro dipeptidase
MNEERTRRLMSEAGLDVLLANSKFNVAYLSGFVQFHWVWDAIQHFMERNIWRDECIPLAGFCLDPQKSPFLASDLWVTRFNYIYPTVDIVDRPHVYGEQIQQNGFSFYPLECTVRALRERGLEEARIGIEDTRLPKYYYEWLQRELPRATFIPADNFFWRIRAVKTPEEVRRLREAFRIATQVYYDTFDMMKPGVALRDIQQMQMERASELGGLWYFNHLWVHSPNSAWDPPADYVLQKGDEGGVDLGIYYQGYGSDFGRTVSLGPVHPAIRNEYESFRSVYEAMRATARIGNTGADIYQAAQEAIAKDLGKRAVGPLPAGCLGHGLGLECHEIPAILPSENDPIEENMVIQVEVGNIEQTRQTHLFLEDAGVITKDGWERLNDLSQDIFVLG